jgi:hypothetical protein
MKPVSVDSRRARFTWLLWGGTAVGLVGLVVCIWVAAHTFRMFRRDVFHDDAARRYIATNSSLQHLWDECGLARPGVDIVDLVAAEGVLQSGARFLAVVEFGDTRDDYLRNARELEDGQCQDTVLGLSVWGKQYELVPRAGWDGAEAIAIVSDPRDGRGTVRIYAYAGDGG